MYFDALMHIILGVLSIAVLVLLALHARHIVLAGVLALIVCAGARHGHHSNVLSQVLLVHEVAHIVLVAHRIFLISLLLLFDRHELRLGQVGDLAEHIDNASVLGLDFHALKLLLHFPCHSLDPTTNLIVDQLHVLLAVVQRLKFSLQVLFFCLQMGKLAFLSLSFVLGSH